MKPASIIGHVIDPKAPVLPMKEELEANYRSGLAERSASGAKFSDEQREAAASSQRREKSRIEFPIARRAGWRDCASPYLRHAARFSATAATSCGRSA